MLTTREQKRKAVKTNKTLKEKLNAYIRKARQIYKILKKLTKSSKKTMIEKVLTRNQKAK